MPIRCNPLQHVRAMLVVISISLAPGIAGADDFSDALTAVRGVGANGEGHRVAARAIQTLNSATPEQIPQLLAAMDGVNKISLNWLRGAVNQAVARGQGKLPSKEIEAYFSNTDHHPMGRLLAFELLTRSDVVLRDQMIPELIDDPSLPLRSKAVQRLIDEAKSLVDTDPMTAIGKYGFALQKARDVGQIQSIATALQGLDINVNLQRQLGFLGTWHLVGNFDNKDMQGFDVAHGPEEDVTMIDLTARYADLDGQEASWKQVTTSDETGIVDLNQFIGKIKGVTVYAATTFKAESEGAAQIRIGTPNATKVWLNGELVMSNEVYHNADSIDKFIGDVQLKKGDNQILIKVCQNEQTDSWAQVWQFQLRVCDSSGKAIAEMVIPKPAD